MAILFAPLQPADSSVLTADTHFHPPSFAIPATAVRTLLLPDGKFLLYYDIETLTDRPTGPVIRFLADGALDPSFNFSRDYNYVGAAAPAGSGRLYVSARKKLYGLEQSEEILRLNSDGSIDTTFHPAIVGADPTFYVREIRVQPDGKVLVAGLFPTFAGENRPGIVRLLTNGTLDSSFAAITLDQRSVYSLALQNDGRILIGGDFDTVNGVESPGVARLNADGSLDVSFQGTGYTTDHSYPVRALRVQSDGKIVLGGRFQFQPNNSTSRRQIIRVDSHGVFDVAFAPVTSTSTIPDARNLLLQPDGKILAAIDTSVYRFTATGMLDSTFHPPVTVNTTNEPSGVPGTTATLNLRPDGRILVGGTFTDINPTGVPTGAHFGVARLNSNGTIDPTFTTSHKTGAAKPPTSFSRLPDRSTLIGFDAFRTHVDPSIPYNFGRLFLDGSVDPNFSLASSAPSGFLSDGLIAFGFSRLADGGFFVFGGKSDYPPSVHIGKVSPAGVVDSGFADDSAVPAFQHTMVLPDGKFLLSAGNDVQATVGSLLSRRQSNGQIDSTFQVDESIRLSQVERGFSGLETLYVGSRPLAAQTDGKILFEYFGNDLRFHLVRLNANGSIDATFPTTVLDAFDAKQDYFVVFDPVANQLVGPTIYVASLPVLDAHIQSDGRIVLAGQFKSFRGVAARGLVRLMPDGTLDNSFSVGTGARWTSTVETSAFFPKVENVAWQGDGRLLITGTFEAFNGVSAPGIASLNPNGSVETSFVPPAVRNKYARGETVLERQGDGSFLLSGPYSLPGEANAPSFIHILGAPAVANLSTRAAIGAGDKVLIGGFIVTGNTPKKVLLRAIASSLNVNGVPVAGRLLDPVLELHGTGVLVTNDDWRSTQEQEIINSTVPPADDRESAIIATLNPGAYTAVMQGKNGGTGIGLVEIYDLGNPNAVTGQQAVIGNISTRGFVQTGDKVMIGGFIISGAPTNIIVRAIGPDLTRRGVPGALQDTILELHDANGVVASNDDWRSTQEQEIIASGVAPRDNREAAIVAHLNPGGYTAIVRGKAGATGVALVEVYKLP